MKLRNQPLMNHPSSSRYVLICCLTIALVLSIQVSIKAEELLIDKIGKAKPAEKKKEESKTNTIEQKILIDAYILQADSFIKKKYYIAALALLDFVKNLDSSNKTAFALEQRIKNDREKDIKKYIQTATLAEHKFDYAAALDSYYRVLELNPFNKAAIDYRRKLFKKLSRNEQLNLAIRNYQQGKTDQAKTLFEGVVAIEPDNQVALGYLGRLDRSSSKASPQIKTESATLETLQADKKIWPLYLEGLKLMRDKKYSEAIDVWEKVLKAYPDNLNTINNINQASLRLQAEEKN
ncbi:MAG: tetratricopeptide repeat protein [candidate division Zixibacteria bacterium]|nr:tetratricopeptide repeat protein [candidate division Zixibacteria bacterium]